MNKQEFLSELRKSLSGLPNDDVEERINFYSEMIDDRIEEGQTEQEAVAGCGDINTIASQIMSEIPLTKLVKEKVKPNRSLRAWEIVLIVLGSPIWLSLAIALFSVGIAVFAVMWSLVVSVVAMLVAFAVSGIACIGASVIFFVKAEVLAGFLLLGCALTLLGLSILSYYLLILTAKAVAFIHKKTFLGIKSCFVKKEASK